MTPRRLLALVTAFGLIGGCASQNWNVDSYTAPAADLPARQTFYWRGGEFGSPASIDATVADAAGAQLRTTITGELVRKGYREVDSAAAADMVVSFQVAATQKFVIPDERRIGAPLPSQVLMPGASQPPPASQVPREQRVREGSVLVFIDDRATGSLLWRGGVNAQARSGTPEQDVRILGQIAREIVREVPARAP